MSSDRKDRTNAADGSTLVSQDGIQGAGFIHRLRETFKLADFTDGGGAAGTVEFANDIPLGAVVLQTLISGVTGFIGDTSAVITVGDGTDVDRYNTGTPSVFTTAANGLDIGVPSGERFHAAAKTIKLTVTSGSDFTSVSAGELTTEFYYQT